MPFALIIVTRGTDKSTEQFVKGLLGYELYGRKDGWKRKCQNWKCKY